MTDKELYKMFSGKKTLPQQDNLLSIGNLSAELKNKFDIAFNIIKDDTKTKTLAVVISINDKPINRFILPPQGARRLRDTLIECL